MSNNSPKRGPCNGDTPNVILKHNGQSSSVELTDKIHQTKAVEEGTVRLAADSLQPKGPRDLFGELATVMKRDLPFLLRLRYLKRRWSEGMQENFKRYNDSKQPKGPRGGQIDIV